VLDIINFAQGDFFMLGGYALWLTLEHTHSFVLGVVFAGLAIGVAGGLVLLALVWPLLDRPRELRDADHRAIELAGDPPDIGCGDSRRRRDRFWRERHRQLTYLVEAGADRADTVTRLRQTLLEQHVDEREQKQLTGAWVGLRNRLLRRLLHWKD